MEAECISHPPSCNLIHACSFDSAMEKSPAHNRSDGTAPAMMAAAMTSCFDCNICFDLVVDPVVTLCGHLYCWPCIYKWMQGESVSCRQCPVCKAFLSRDTVVPLFGRGRHSGPKVAPGIPLRPASNLTQHSQFQHRPRSRPRRRRLNESIAYDDSSSLTAGVGGLAFSVLLPWVHSRQDILTLSGGNNPRIQRQQLQVESSLHQILVFLFCCAVVCLLVF